MLTNLYYIFYVIVEILFLFAIVLTAFQMDYIICRLIFNYSRSISTLYLKELLLEIIIHEMIIHFSSHFREIDILSRFRYLILVEIFISSDLTTHCLIHRIRYDHISQYIKSLCPLIVLWFDHDYHISQLLSFIQLFNIFFDYLHPGLLRSL